MAIDWKHVALGFWGQRFEEDRLAALKGKDYRKQIEFNNNMWVGHYREADCKNAAERIDNFGRAMREIGIAVMIEKRCRR